MRFIIRCLGSHFIPLLGELVSEIIQVYSATHHSCFLYLGSILVDEFGTDKTCVPGLIQMLEVCTVYSRRILDEVSSEDNEVSSEDDGVVHKGVDIRRRFVYGLLY